MSFVTWLGLPEEFSVPYLPVGNPGHIVFKAELPKTKRDKNPRLDRFAVSALVLF